MSLNHFLYYIRKGVMYSRVLASLNSNHTIKACHAIFLEGSPGHTIVQCRGLAFARVEVTCIRVYHSEKKDLLGIDIIIKNITNIYI